MSKLHNEICLFFLKKNVNNLNKLIYNKLQIRQKKELRSSCRLHTINGQIH